MLAILISNTKDTGAYLKDNDKYFKNVVLYIHNNPVHHGYKTHPIEWGWSSYDSFLLENLFDENKKLVLDWFHDKENFEFMHNQKLDIIKIEEYLKL